MLEISPINVKNWWTTPLMVDRVSEISLKNLGLLELHLAKQRTMLSNWSSEPDNRRMMGRDENRTPETKSRLPRHPLYQPNLLVQTKIIDHLHLLKAYLSSKKWIQKVDYIEKTSKKLIEPEMNYLRKSHGPFFKQNWDLFNLLRLNHPLLWRTSRSFSELMSLRRRREFHQQLWPPHLIWQRLPKILATMNTCRKLTTYVAPMLMIKLLSPLSTSC